MPARRFYSQAGLPIDHRMEEVENYLESLAQAINDSRVAGPDYYAPIPTYTAAPAGDIPEESVIFDDSSGHDHSSVGTPVPLAGDASGTNESLVVVGLQGVAVPAPGAGDDLLALVYQHGGPALAWGVPPGRIWVQDWWYDDAAAGLTAQLVKRLANAAPPTFRDVFICPVVGSVTRVWVKSNAARTAGTLTAEVYVAGVASGAVCVLDGTNTTFSAAAYARGAKAVGAGDNVDVRITTTGAWAPTTADLAIGVEITD